MICRVCGTEMFECEVVKKCRAEHIQVKKTPFEMVVKDILIYKCPQCTHIQIADFFSDGYYKDYVANGAGCMQYIGDLNLMPMKVKKLKKYTLRNESIIEIGCGSGEALQEAQKHFSYCLGIEPSKIEYERAKSKGLNVINEYFAKNTLNLKKTFSAFMSFQVFEHLSELYTVLEYAWDILDEEGVGLINVPNGQLIFENGLYHQITMEHINYFTPYSIAVMANKAGFDIIDIKSIDDTFEVDLYVRKRENYSGFNKTKNSHKNKLHELVKDSSFITIWGAGAKASVYSQLIDEGIKIQHIIDSSSLKWGKFVSGIAVPVEPISKKVIKNSDAIIIFASSYNDEIIKSLKEEYYYKGKIIYFDKENINKC